MKRFWGYVAFTCVLFIGVGAVVDKAAARFRSDAKALEVIGKARQAIGGDAAIAEVRALSIKGQTTTTRTIDGMARTDQGETEIVMQFPNKMLKMVKMGSGSGTAEGSAMKIHDVIVMKKAEGTVIEGKDGEFTTADGKKVIVRKMEGGDATFTSPDGKTFDIKIAPGSGDVQETVTPDGKKIVVRRMEGGNAAAFVTKDGENVNVDGKEIRIARTAAAHAGAAHRNNEMLRLTLALLVTAPEGMDVSYSFVGEGNIDGTSVNTVDASFAGATYRLHFDRDSNLPVGMSYKGHMPVVIHMTRADKMAVETEQKVMAFTKTAGETSEAESFVRFEDFRSTGSVQLPYRWTTSRNGTSVETFNVVSYEINPANIAERFDAGKTQIRIVKPVEK